MDTTERIIKEVIDGIDNNYTKDEKIRYVYIELGKRLSKDVDYFFSALDKLGDMNLSASEMKAIYNNKDLSKKVICKPCTIALKKVFDRIGIESKIMMTTSFNTIVDKDNNSFQSHHYFLCCKGDNDKNYFLTLSADLGNIHMGNMTEHFATDIPYLDSDNKPVYVGKEIKNSVMSLEYIKSIDEKIGYLKDQYFKKKNGKIIPELNYSNYSIELLKNSYYRNNEYYLHLEENIDNEFYRTVQIIPNITGSITQLNGSSIDKIKRMDLSIWKSNILTLVSDKINEELGDYFNLDAKEKLNNLVVNNNIKDWSNLIISEVSKLDLEQIDVSRNFDPIMLVRKVNDLFNNIESNKTNSYSVRKIIDNIAYQFINPELILPKNQDEYISNYYIANKFEFEMNRILDLGTKTDFSSLEYAEQTDTISDLLEAIFPEITVKNSSRIKNYDVSTSPVRNRIVTSAVKNRDTKEYSFLFHITGDINDDTYTYLYNPKTNLMESTELFSVVENNVIITSKLNPTIGSIETIDKNDSIRTQKK